MKAATMAPVYVALYPALAEVARRHGFALAIHGSVVRDFDLIGIPWVETPSHPDKVVEDMKAEFALKTAGEPDTTLHGRRRYTLLVGFGECFCDLQFMPGGW
jgi:hypothetical protein